MPIPPRPIPSRRPLPSHTLGPHSASSSPKPGYTVPQKAAPLAASLDWRAEVALLDSMPKYGTSNGFPRLAGQGSSAPNATGTGMGVKLVDASQQAREKMLARETRNEGREVMLDLEDLVEAGKGKRERRSFDFIPHPNILSLSDSMTDEPSLRTPPLDPTTPARSSPSQLSDRAGQARSMTDEDEEEELEEWEHVGLPAQGQERDTDMIMVGEMELDEQDPFHGLAEDARNPAACGHGGKIKLGAHKVPGRLSYAAALGRLR